VPVLNFAQDSINILGYGELAVGIGDRNRIRRNFVGEFGLGCGSSLKVISSRISGN
jgi:hypothetical protein